MNYLNIWKEKIKNIDFRNLYLCVAFVGVVRKQREMDGGGFKIIGDINN